jgi:hypothetical protein
MEIFFSLSSFYRISKHNKRWRKHPNPCVGVQNPLSKDNALCLVLEGAARSSVLCWQQMTFWSMVYQRRIISWKPVWSTNIGWLSRGVVEGFAWYSGSRKSNMQVGGSNTATQVKFRVLLSRWNARSSFNWLCLIMNLLKVLFWGRELAPEWKYKVCLNWLCLTMT